MDITLKRNTDRNFKLTVTKDGAPVDVTGWAVRFTVKAKADDTDAQALVNKIISTIPTPAAGIINLTIDAEDTIDKPVGVYPCDFKIKNGDGKLYSTITGYFRLVQEITDEVN